MVTAHSAQHPHVIVVIPAHDEAGAIGAAVTAVRASAHHADVQLRLIVVADACTDDTAAIARSAGVEVLEIGANNVGAARAAGFEHALTGLADVTDAPLGAEQWLVTTDADSHVPLDWFAKQAEHRDRGADVVVGTVMLAPVPGADPVGLAWAAEYAEKITGRRHSHIHGANLAFTARAYRAVAGFRSLADDEDVDLVARLRRSDAVVVTATDMPVMTSRRTTGRAPRGFAQTLGALHA
nr:glycosyltransferase [Nesterenkonia sp. YGD6]